MYGVQIQHTPQILKMKKRKDTREDYNSEDRKRKIILKKKKQRHDDAYFNNNKFSNLDDFDEFED